MINAFFFLFWWTSTLKLNTIHWQVQYNCFGHPFFITSCGQKKYILLIFRVLFTSERFWCKKSWPISYGNCYYIKRVKTFWTDSNKRNTWRALCTGEVGYEMARGGNPTVVYDTNRNNVVLHFNRGKLLSVHRVRP